MIKGVNNRLTSCWDKGYSYRQRMFRDGFKEVQLQDVGLHRL